MQPKTSEKLTPESFEVLKRTMRSIQVEEEIIKIPKLPEFLAVKLTNRCNMRCKHCYEWNEKGYHHLLDENDKKGIIDIEMIKNLLDDTKNIKSRFYLWGGEPLLHPEFPEIAKLFIDDPREVSICTNGTLIEKHLDCLINMSEVCYLELLIAIEGFEAQHDNIRGKGTYQMMFQQLKTLLKLRESGVFKGKISVHTVINDHNVDNLYDLLCFYEKLNIDLVMLCYPWYISEETSASMTQFFHNSFQGLLERNQEEQYSWDSFKFRLSGDKIANLKKELDKINAKTWENCVRYQPDLGEKELVDFINGGDLVESANSRCMSIFSRADIFANGDVSVCKHFTEFVVGNLRDSSLSEIWNSEKYQKIREILWKERMPVCSKCNALYLHNLRK